MRAIVLVPDVDARQVRRSAPAGSGDRLAQAHSLEDRLQEAVGLAQAIDLDVRYSAIVPLPHLRPGTLFGSGKVEEIKALVEEHEAGLVIIDRANSPVQQRNL
jgi:GTP-binding protein HflX